MPPGWTPRCKLATAARTAGARKVAGHFQIVRLDDVGAVELGFAELSPAECPWGAAAERAGSPVPAPAGTEFPLLNRATTRVRGIWPG